MSNKNQFQWILLLQLASRLLRLVTARNEENFSFHFDINNKICHIWMVWRSMFAHKINFLLQSCLFGLTWFDLECNHFPLSKQKLVLQPKRRLGWCKYHFKVSFSSTRRRRLTCSVTYMRRVRQCRVGIQSVIFHLNANIFRGVRCSFVSKSSRWQLWNKKKILI